MRVDYDKDQLSYALANALKERDEARKIASELAIQAERLRKGRDEAKEALQILADYTKNEIKRLRMICQHAHDRLLRGAPDNDLLLILEKSWKEKTK
jgi:hypothetical protein